MSKSLVIKGSAVALLLAFSLTIASCGSGPIGDSTTTSGSSTSSSSTSSSSTTDGSSTTGITASMKDGVLIAASDLARVATPAPDADVRSASASIGAFGADLYTILAQGAGQGNLVFSPASIEMALAMTYAGAKGDTAAEMAKALHFTLQGGTLHGSFNSLDTLLESRSWQGKDEEGHDLGVLVKTANSLWAQKDLAFEKLFLDTLAKDYAAGIRLVDYKKAAEDARETINRWVAGQTNDKITDLIPSGALNELTRLVLVNAVYLDATWANQFDKASTADGTFATLSGRSVTAHMMSQSSPFAYGKGDGWQAIELPYAHDDAHSEMDMLVIVPDQGKFAGVEAQLKSGLVDQAVSALGDPAEIELTMPKFKFRTQTALASALKSLGMKKAFDDTAADFSGMTTQESLCVNDVIHEAYIALDEKGTEAAAATAVIMRATAMPLQPQRLTIDRPFLFALRDKDTGAILFLGRVTDPTAE